MDAHAEKMCPGPGGGLPMEEQARTEKDSIQSSRAAARLLSLVAGGDQTGPYFADVLKVKSVYAAALFSRTGGAHSSCPFAQSARRSATVHLGYEQVVDTLLTREEKLESGEATRGNDIGLLRLNSAMFPRTGTVMLGFGPEDHRVLRDFFGEGSSKLRPKPGLPQRLQEQVLSQDRLDVSMAGDLAIWASRELWMALLDLPLGRREGADWVAHQASVLRLATKPAKLARGGKALADKLERWLPMVRAALEENCGVSDPRRLDVLADVAYDTLLFAGGMSLPMVLIAVTGLRMNGVVPRDFEVDPAMAQNFALEAVRCFPPVFSVPQWSKDGSQTIAAIATAMTDPSVFGKGFKCDRSMAEFAEKGCNFAEKAGPKYCCPGRAFTLEVVAAYALAFRPDEWRAQQKGGRPGGQALLRTPEPPYFRDAVLLARRGPRPPPAGSDESVLSV